MNKIIKMIIRVLKAILPKKKKTQGEFEKVGQY